MFETIIAQKFLQIRFKKSRKAIYLRITEIIDLFPGIMNTCLGTSYTFSWLKEICSL